MAKYDWKQLEKEYILSECISVSEFLKSKNIDSNSYTRNNTKGWKEKKKQNTDKKVAKTIEKVTEKKAEQEATKIANLKNIGNELALKIEKSINELDRHIAKSKKKTKTIKYDYNVGKPKEEVIKEEESITDYISIIDRQGLKLLTSALKDLSEILGDENDNTETVYIINDLPTGDEV